MTFDSLGFVRRLEKAGVERQQAEAHVDVARDPLLPDLATRDDLAIPRADPRGDMSRTEERLNGRLDALEQRMTIKLGGLLVLALGLFTAIDRLLT